MMVSSAWKGGAIHPCPPTYFISAGEASGEHYGALLIEALKKQLAASGRTARFFGMGGPRMAAAGLERVVRSEDVAVMGLTEVVRHLPRIYGEFRKLKKAIRERRPDVAVLIDFPEIHFRLARSFTGWAFRSSSSSARSCGPGRSTASSWCRKYIDRMLVIFPFEEPFYRERGVRRSLSAIRWRSCRCPSITREQFAAARTAWTPRNSGSACCPAAAPARFATICRRCWRRRGASRAIRAIQRTGAKADIRISCRSLAGSSPSGEDSPILRVSRAPGSHPQRGAAARCAGPGGKRGGGLFIRLVDDARAALFHARASVVASGTATVEAALIGNPFVVVYRVSPLTYAIAKRVVKVPHVAMANLIAGKRVVPELIQHDFTAQISSNRSSGCYPTALPASP